MIPSLTIVGSISVTELCLGFAFLRGASMERAARELEGWFELAADPGELDRPISRMLERGWIAPHPHKVCGYTLTETGEDVVEQAFKGFVRFIDAGENRWDVGMMFQIARTYYDRRRN